MPAAQRLADISLEAARAGAAIVRAAWSQPTSTEFKGAVDPVTEIDRLAEVAITEVLTKQVPDDGVLAEEGSNREGRTGRTWIVDPLDGTVNFVHRLPHVGVSVAVWQEESPLAGTVISVGTGEEFVAELTGGTTRNGEPLLVSSVGRLEEALIATGFPYDRVEHGRAYARTMGEVLVRSQGIRRQGSATLDFVSVAAGEVDAYYEFGLSPWDAAAGALLVVEAGGQVTDHRGAPYRIGAPSVVASNGRIHDELLTVLAANLPDHVG